VLDEVDAPLDDYNVERFCDLLEEMRKRSDTRFVTSPQPDHHGAHGPLFGVTMAERGVSQIVSSTSPRPSGSPRRAESFLSLAEKWREGRRMRGRAQANPTP